MNAKTCVIWCSSIASNTAFSMPSIGPRPPPRWPARIASRPYSPSRSRGTSGGSKSKKCSVGKPSSEGSTKRVVPTSVPAGSCTWTWIDTSSKASRNSPDGNSSAWMKPSSE